MTAHDTTDRFGIGGNNPPDALAYDPLKLEASKKSVTDFTLAAGEWMDLGAIDTEERAAKATDYLHGAQKIATALEEERKAQKKPHDDGAKAVQGAYKPLADMMDKSVKAVKALQAPWLKKKQDEENARKAREQADAQAAQEEADRLAAQAEARNDIAGMVEAEAAQKSAGKAIKAASRTSKVKVDSATGAGRASTLKVRKLARVENINHAFVTYREHPEVEELLTRLANADVRSQQGEKTAPKGFTLYEQEYV